MPKAIASQNRGVTRGRAIDNTDKIIFVSDGLCLFFAVY